MKKTNSDLMAELVIELKNSRNTLSIKEIAQILGNVFDDIELSSLIEEIKKLAIID